jgi:hypothetical protein
MGTARAAWGMKTWARYPLTWHQFGPETGNYYYQFPPDTLGGGLSQFWAGVNNGVSPPKCRIIIPFTYGGSKPTLTIDDAFLRMNLTFSGSPTIEAWLADPTKETVKGGFTDFSYSLGSWLCVSGQHDYQFSAGAISQLNSNPYSDIAMLIDEAAERGGGSSTLYYTRSTIYPSLYLLY